MPARLVFRFPPSTKFSMAKVWAAMLEGAAGNCITEWQISATTLEDVFVAIAKDSEARFGTA